MLSEIKMHKLKYYMIFFTWKTQNTNEQQEERQIIWKGKTFSNGKGPTDGGTGEEGREAWKMN